MMALALIGLLVAIVVVGVVIGLSSSPTAAPRSYRPLTRLPSTGYFDLSVVGESFYTANLRNIVGGTHEVRHNCEATLVLEDNNPHDSNAVRVEIGGLQVGHLPRSRAVKYRRLLSRIGGQPAMSCAAVIVGGGRDRPNLGVWLDVDMRIPRKKKITESR